MDQRHQVRLLKLESRNLNCQIPHRINRLSSSLREVERRVKEAQSDPRGHHIDLNDIEYLKQTIQEVEGFKADTRKDFVVIRSLASNRSARQAAIPQAHRKTFGWVFSEPEADGNQHASSPSLLNWLQHGDGAFWISGKPGSGKSTFMKFLACDQRTRDALVKWSDPKPVAIGTHYFWCAGSPMERSQQGLVKALLSEVLRQYPDLVELLFQNRWAEPQGSSLTATWSMSELFNALRDVVAGGAFPAKLCFFIDGLDEYDGDQLELCRELTALSKSGNIKLCLSSRPWSVFMEAFGRAAQLCLHNLTRCDMENYTRQRICKHPSWQELSIDEERANWLVSETATRSEGVFLWTHLVTKMLLEELRPPATFSDLQTRLESFPTDLDALFGYMLEDAVANYPNIMATSFLMALAADRSLDISIYYFHDIEYEDTHYVLNLSSEAPGRLEYKSQRSRTEQHLNNRCQGLLTTSVTTGTVSFLHRTVRDFFEPPEVHEMLLTIAPPKYNATASLFKAFAAWIKQSRAAMAEEPKVEFVSSVQSLCLYASQIDSISGQDNTMYHRILDNLDHDLKQKGPSAEESLHLLRLQVIRSRLASYLRHVLPLEPAYLASLDVLPLVAALCPNYQPGESVDAPNCWDDTTVKTLDILFQHSADPNEPFAAQDMLVSKNVKTPWTMLCEITLPHHEYSHLSNVKGHILPFRMALEHGIFALFLKNGASVNSLCSRPGKPPSLPCVDYLFHCFHVSNEDDLTALYLINLDTFLNADPTIWRPFIELFFRSLETQLSQMNNLVGQGSFFVAITEKMLLSQVQLDGVCDFPWETIERIFGKATSDNIRRHALC